MPRTREEYLRAKREGMARLRAADPEAARAKAREWHARNRDRQRAKLRDYYKRRFFWAKATKLRQSGAASFQDLARLWKKQRGRCALTGRRLDREIAELDHKLPKVRGGGDEISNLQWVCRAANLAKRDLTDDEFTELCANVMQWIGQRIDMVEQIETETDR